jgi:hypothetical protein
VTTPPCRVPAPGYYVWVESIDPADTPVDQGRDRLRPWRSPFGTASEVTFSPAGVAVQTHVGDPTPSAGSCTIDDLDVTGVPATASASGLSVEVESVLVGPFADPIADGRDLSDIESYPVAGTTSTRIAADGSYETPCIRVTTPGHYVYVFRSAGSAPDSAGHQLIPAFSDLTAHASEMLRVTEPDRPTPPPTVPPTTAPPTVPPTTAPPTSPPIVVPPTSPSVTPKVVSPPATPPGPRTSRPVAAALAFTGSDGTPGLVALGAAGVTLGGVTLAARALLRRRKAVAGASTGRDSRE